MALKDGWYQDNEHHCCHIAVLDGAQVLRVCNSDCMELDQETICQTWPTRETFNLLRCWPVMAANPSPHGADRLRFLSPLPEDPDSVCEWAEHFELLP